RIGSVAAASDVRDWMRCHAVSAGSLAHIGPWEVGVGVVLVEASRNRRPPPRARAVPYEDAHPLPVALVGEEIADVSDSRREAERIEEPVGDALAASLGVPLVVDGHAAQHQLPAP